MTTTFSVRATLVAVGVLAAYAALVLGYAAPAMAQEVNECIAHTETIVSDTTNTVATGNAPAVAVAVHPGWTASIPGATWIWESQPTTLNETVAFEKQFTVVGTVLSATLDIASDNNYRVLIDGVEVALDANANNFQLATQDTHNLTAFVTPGTHTLRIEVTNIGTYNVSSNPAGLLYKLVVESEECPPPLCPCECANEHEVGETGYDSPYIKKNGISISVKNSGCIINTTASSASTGGNTAGGSYGGAGGHGGSVTANANGGDAKVSGNNGGAEAGNGGNGGNAGQGGVVITGTAISMANTINSLNGTEVDIAGPELNSSSVEIEIDNGACDCNTIDNRTRSRARTGSNDALGSEGGSGGSGGDIEAEAEDGDAEANGNNGGSVAGDGGTGGSGGRGGNVRTGLADSTASTTNRLNFTRINLFW